MILDKQAEFSDAQAVTATAISTNVMDLGGDPTLQDIGAGKELYLVVLVDTAATAAGAATVTFSLESDSTADLATSATTHITTTAIGKASLTAGAVVLIQALPPDDYERYLGVRYTVATGPLTAGKFDAFLTETPDTYRAYPDNATLS